MKVRFSPWSLLGLSIALVAVLMSASAVLAQSSDAGGPFAALGGVMLVFFVVFGLAAYVYVSLAVQTIADTYWRLDRIRAMENNLFSLGFEEQSGALAS